MVASGMSGQAVLEGVLMKNENKYALAVRKPNKDIEVLVGRFSSISEKNAFFKLPFVRGIVNFIEEIYLGIRNFSALGEFYEEEEKKDEPADKSELFQLLVVIAVISAAIGIFIALPYGLLHAFSKITDSAVLMTLIEGAVRLVLLIIYIVGISMLPDVKRLYMYIGAEHKVMNCVDKGIPLTISNVRRMGRKYYKCGTVFLFTVIILSALLFMFIRIENMPLRIILRLLIIPAVAAIVYEVRELSIQVKNPIVTLFNIPIILVQGITSDEPGEEMIEVAIKSASAIIGNEALAETYEKEPEKETVKAKTTPKQVLKRVSRQRMEKTDKAYKNKKTSSGEAGEQNKLKLDKKAKTKNEQQPKIKPEREKRLAERTKLAVDNKENKKASHLSDDEDDEILNALNHFFNSKKEEDKNNGRRK